MVNRLTVLSPRERNSVRELLRSNDLVFITWVRAVLSGEGIDSVVLDGHISLVEGSIGAFPRRIMVDDGHFERARALVEAGPEEVPLEELERQAEQSTMAEIAVSRDTLLGGRVEFLQPKQGFRAAIDAVLLAAALPATPGQRVLDVGCGVGTAGLCLARRIEDVSVDGVDVQADLVGLARENAALNGFEHRMEFFTADIAADARPPLTNHYDHVMTNPPFGDPTRHRAPDDMAGTLARIETGPTLESWLDYCLRRLKSRGRLSLIHRADALDRILSHLSGRLGNLVVFPLWPKRGQAAKRVIVSGQKERRTPLIMAPGLELHDGTGDYAVAARRILWEGAGLDLERGSVT